MVYSQCCFNSVPCNHWRCKNSLDICPHLVSSTFVDDCLHESSHNYKWPTSICNPIHMGRRRLFADPDCLPTAVWKSLWSSGAEGLLLLILIWLTITLSLLRKEYSLFQHGHFRLGLCFMRSCSGQSQLFTRRSLLKSNIVDKLAYCSSSPSRNWRRRHCQRCMGHNCRNCRSQTTCKVVSSTQYNLELLGYCWTPSWRSLQ